MKFNLPIFISLIFVLCSSQELSGQEREISGVLKDGAYPLIGATVQLKRTNTGVLTDIDGVYKIKCREGDTFHVNYVGYATQYIIISPELYYGQKTKKPNTVQTNPIQSSAYAHSINKKIIEDDSIPSFRNQNILTFDINDFRYAKYKLKKIKIEAGAIRVKARKAPINYAVNYNFQIASQFVKKGNLPALQNEFAQGRSINQELQFQDQSNKEIYSFGPKISTLDFERNHSSIFKPIFTQSHVFGIRTTYKQNHLNLNLNYGIHDDPYQINNSTDKHGSLNFYNKNFKTHISSTHVDDQQADINGTRSSILMNDLLTPSHFDNLYNYKNGNQNFSGGSYANPYGIIKNDLARSNSKIFTSGIVYEINKSNLEITTSLNYQQRDNEIYFNQTANNSVANPYSYSKEVNRQDINLRSQFNWELKSTQINSMIKMHQSLLDYNLIEYIFNPDIPNSNTIDQYRKASTLDYNINITNNSDKNNSIIEYQLSNAIFISNVQKAAPLQPRLSFEINLARWLNAGKNTKYELNLTTSVASFVSQRELLYNNESHNSLNIASASLQSYKAIVDLFPNENLDNENIKKLAVALNASLNRYKYKFNIGYTQELHSNSIFPVLIENSFELQNVGNILTHEIEANLFLNLSRIHYYDNHKIIIGIRKQKAKVATLHYKAPILPIAGFSNISNVLKEGESPGVIYGSAWERTTSGDLSIDDNGYPIESSQKKIIGDPIPDFNVDLLYIFNKNKISFQVLIDAQIGGQFWDGTEAVLDFHGRSERSGELRNQDLVFEGQLLNGDQNQQTVAAYDPKFPVKESIFQRYGEIGVSESYIKDASYLNLKLIEVAYSINSHSNLFRSLDLKLYGQNLLQINANKESNPYSNFLSNTNINGLQFFNNPLQTEVGLKLILNL